MPAALRTHSILTWDDLQPGSVEHKVLSLLVEVRAGHSFRFLDENSAPAGLLLRFSPLSVSTWQALPLFAEPLRSGQYSLAVRCLLAQPVAP